MPGKAPDPRRVPASAAGRGRREGVVIGKHVELDGRVRYSGAWWALALPQVTIPLHVGLAAATAAVAMARGARPWTLPLGLASGLLLWTAFEYAFHRWLLHHTRHALLRRVFWQALHREHHAYRQMHDPEHRTVHPAISVPVVLGVVLTTIAASRGGFAPAAAAGWALGYCAYEALHWLFHSGRPRDGAGALLRSLWDAHEVHHLRHADANYGFVTGLWDRVLGTRRG